MIHCNGYALHTTTCAPIGSVAHAGNSWQVCHRCAEYDARVPGRRWHVRSILGVPTEVVAYRWACRYTLAGVAMPEARVAARCRSRSRFLRF